MVHIATVFTNQYTIFYLPDSTELYLPDSTELPLTRRARQSILYLAVRNVLKTLPETAAKTSFFKGIRMGTILIIVLILMLLGAFPAWPHSKGWGYGPTGGLGLVLTIIIILVLLGRI
jgi:hypothetical protein